MKTIAISIEESLLVTIDRIARQARGGVGAKRRPNRSEVIREAVLDFILRRQRAQRESRERLVLSRHRKKLQRQLEALVPEQEEP
jgi:metal-responsive CopG/Arc/MetJ family transcriptional regulator